MSSTAALERVEIFFCKPSILSKHVVLLTYFLLNSTNAAMSFYEINETKSMKQLFRTDNMDREN